jgi:peptidoglycan/xylan/chitin deacetylase (PgdA/CDA1 family)
MRHFSFSSGNRPRSFSRIAKRRCILITVVAGVVFIGITVALLIGFSRAASKQSSDDHPFVSTEDTTLSTAADEPSRGEVLKVGNETNCTSIAPADEAVDFVNTSINFPQPPRQGSSIRGLNHCGLSHRVAVFSFDDGPSRIIPTVLEELKEQNITATFLISPAKNYDEPVNYSCAYLKRMIEDGHEVKSHSYHHRMSREHSIEEFRHELELVEDWVSECLQNDTRYTSRVQLDLFRPPFGDFDSALARASTEENYAVFTWNMDVRDWESENVTSLDTRQNDLMARVTNLYENRQTESLVILMHDYAYINGYVNFHIKYIEFDG